MPSPFGSFPPPLRCSPSRRPAPAAPYAAPTSTLSSLFGRYTIQGDFGAKDPKEWGGTTTWLAADGTGTVVVMVRVAPYFRFFTTQGAPIRQWGDKELFSGEAHSVHFGPDGSVWATDSVDHTVRKFSPTGQLLLTLGKQKVAGDNTSQDAFNRPNAVAFGPNGNVFVSDGYANQRVVEFTPEGKFLRVFGGKKGKGDGEMAMVHGVANDAQGRVYATDSDNQRVLVFDAQGKFLKNIAIPARGGSFMASDGTFYISDVNSGAVGRSEERPDRGCDQGRGTPARARCRSDDRRCLHVIDGCHTAWRDQGDRAQKHRQRDQLTDLPLKQT